MKTYNVKEVAEMLNTNPETVRRWIRNGSLEATQSSKKDGLVISDQSLSLFVDGKPKYAELYRKATEIAWPVEWDLRKFFETKFPDMDDNAYAELIRFMGARLAQKAKDTQLLFFVDANRKKKEIDSLQKKIEDYERKIEELTRMIDRIGQMLAETYSDDEE